MDNVQLDSVDGGYGQESKLACNLLDLFTSVGTASFDLTTTNYHGEKVRFRRHLLPSALKQLMPGLLHNAEIRHENVIVRPAVEEAQSTALIQLDDLDANQLARVSPVAFVSLKTSVGNYQAWVAVNGAGGDKDFARRLRKAAGADPSASGATRIAGSLNFKEKYAPNFPRVELIHCRPGHVVSDEQLAEAGLLPSAETIQRPPQIRISRARAGVRQWPSYERCVKNAPVTHGGDAPDISRADFTWCMTAIDWGWTVEETAAFLMEISTKAQENGNRYAELTAQNAAVAVKRRANTAHK